MGRTPLHWLAVGLSALLASCAAVPRYDDQVYRGHGLAFRTGPLPAGWSRIDTSHGLLAFRHEEQQATMLVNGRCGADADDVPLAALTAHLFMRFTERTVDEETVIPFDGREAMRTVMTAKLDGVPRRFEAHVLKKDGCVYDFVLIAEPGTFDGVRAGYEGFVQGFHAGSR